MTRGRWNLLAAGAGTVGVVLLAMRGLSGCYSAVPNDGLVDAGPPKLSDAMLPDSGADSDFVGPGGRCDGSAGAVPASNCFSGGAVACPTAATKCSLGTVATCGETSCLPMTDNAKTAPIYNFRMESLNITSPTVLMNTLVESVIAGGVTLNAPSCGYGAAVSTTGAFSWLLSVDKKNNTIMTGGGAPVTNPYSTGYCWVKGTFGANDVAPLTVPLTFKGDAFTTTPFKQTLNIPIFATLTMTSNPIILPIRSAQFSGVGISRDGNCIGDINPEWPGAATSSCAAMLPASCPKWFTNGALAGYITLKDANTVDIMTVGGTLCGVLTQHIGSSCTSPSDFTMGDYCSTTQSPGGCNDSFWLSATFAANAVKIYESKTAPCGE
jgi:hypothetical protein